MGEYPLDPFDLGLERDRRPDAQSLCARPQLHAARRAAGARQWRRALSAFAVGTETDGSVACPAAMNGMVGLKPTLGLVSRTHVVPISHSQDTAGPMARSVRDAAGC